MNTGFPNILLGIACPSASGRVTDPSAAEESPKFFLYIGNRVEKPSSWDTKAPVGKGFGVFSFDPQSGAVHFIKSVHEHISVGEMCIDPRRNILYAVDEVMSRPSMGKGGGGGVYAFSIDPRSGDLTEINNQPSYGSLPSHLAIDYEGKYLIVINHTGNTPITKTVKDKSGHYRIVTEYDDATTVLFRLHEDGSIGDPYDVVVHSGSGPDPEQTHPRVHSVVRSPFGELFAVCDKGTDDFFMYCIEHNKAKLKVCEGGHFKASPGSLPRYSTFHPVSPYLYMNYEAKPFISAFRYDLKGTLTLFQTIRVVPEEMEIGRKDMQSDIKVHPCGKYLYTLVRGINAISVFKITKGTGELVWLQTTMLDCAHPRGFEFSPDGRFLVIAAPKSENVVVWSIGEDGTVSATGIAVSQPNPGNVKFFPTKTA